VAQKRSVVTARLVKIKSDTATKCDPQVLDSLSSQIASANQSSDSLITCYEKKDSLMTQILANKDTQLLLCNSSYRQIRDLAQEGMLREQQLTESLNTALKAQKRKRLQNRWLATGLVFISGITTTFYIKSKQ